MATVRFFYEDLVVASALLRRDEVVTKQFLYKQCYPLFKSIFDNYYTDCASVKEFIDEIYLLILTPGRKTGRCQLQNYKGESTLASWMKSVCLFYCFKKYKTKQRLPVYMKSPATSRDDGDDGSPDRFIKPDGSIEIDFSHLDYHDAMVILSLMPNKRYSNLIRLRYLEHKTNEETAKELGLTRDNFYNKHKLAKQQFVRVLNKEANHGK